NARLTHQEVRQACGASATQKEMTCPCCGRSHLQLFGADDFKCQNGCSTAQVAAAIRERLSTGITSAPAAPKPPTGPPEGSLHLPDYGIAKHLSADNLTKGFGAYEGKHPYYEKVNGVCFPYFDEHGVEITQQ